MKLGIDLLNLIYPVGSIYLSVNSVNPSTIFGGTWKAWGKGRTPVGIDVNQTEFNAVEKTGGSKTHTLTIDELANHNHSLSNIGTTTLMNIGSNYGTYIGLGTKYTEYTGGNKPHNNLQPYIICYMWKRTA